MADKGFVSLIGAERAYLMLYNEDRELEVRAARNWDQESLTETDIGLSYSVIDAALEEGQPIVTTNAQADERFSGQSIVVQKLRSIICVPLMLGGMTVGVLYADNRYRKAVFEPDVAPLLAAFGTQAAIAIVNAHTFERVSERLDRARQVMQELRIDIDMDTVEQRVDEITGTSYFQELTNAAKEMRRRRKEGIE